MTSDVAGQEDGVGQGVASSGRFGRRTRNVVLTVHIVVSVGLLGDSAGFLAVAIRRSLSNDPAMIESSHELLGMFALFFGIPLSFLTLITGVALGMGTRFGVFRHGWVIAKLVLIVTVIIVGATVLRPVLSDDAGADSGSGMLIAGAAYDVVALTAATALAVFKPRRRTSINSHRGLVALRGSDVRPGCR
jgi:hypothetical protein